MQFHHMCLVVTDMEEALRLWRDTLGFTPYTDLVIPDEGCVFFDQATLDDIFKVKGARSRMVMLRSDDGAKIELQAPETPQVERPTREEVGYGRAGLTELALTVVDIDSWFDKIREAGYETQTDYVWSVRGGRLRSFLFHDADGALIQFVETYAQPAAG
jgi:catechol 2,3-dioxygenase-like lactoylglutathione lyase family enzyme